MWKLTCVREKNQSYQAKSNIQVTRIFTIHTLSIAMKKSKYLRPAVFVSVSLHYVVTRYLFNLCLKVLMYVMYPKF